MSSIVPSLVRIIGIGAFAGGSAGVGMAGPVGAVIGAAVGVAGSAVLLTALIMLTGAVAIAEDAHKPDK